jgi:large subunit ribosomal protein L24
MKLKKGDNVIVVAGKEKGKKGKIVRVLPTVNKVVIDGFNMAKKHQRPRRTGEKGTLVNTPMPIHASNVMIADPKTGKPSRLGKKKVGKEWVRVARKSNQEV